jgi:uncharacterized protein HemX
VQWLPYVQVGTLLIAVLALGVAFATFRRQGGWRRADRSAEAQNKTTLEIKQVDAEARRSVGELERKLDGEVEAIVKRIADGDGETRQSLQRVESGLRRAMETQGKEIATMQERLTHLPTHADLARLNASMGEMATAVARVEGAVDKGAALQIRIEKTLERLEDGLLNRR